MQINTPTTVCIGVVVQRNGALLMVQRKNAPGAGKWSIPGGRLEPGEILREAAQREALEETGLDVEVGKLIGTTTIVSENDDRFLVYDFAATLKVIDAEPVAASDATACRFVPTNEVEALDLVDRLGDWLIRHGIIARS